MKLICVLEAADADELQVQQKYIEDRGFKTSLIIDEGRTEIDPFTPTALGVEVLNKNNPHVAATFGEFRLFSDPRDVQLAAYEKHLRDNADPAQAADLNKMQRTFDKLWWLM